MKCLSMIVTTMWRATVSLKRPIQQGCEWQWIRTEGILMTMTSLTARHTMQSRRFRGTTAVAPTVTWCSINIKVTETTNKGIYFAWSRNEDYWQNNHFKASRLYSTGISKKTSTWGKQNRSPTEIHLWQRRLGESYNDYILWNSERKVFEIRIWKYAVNWEKWLCALWHDSEKSDHGLTKVLSQHLPVGTEKNHKNHS